MRSSNGSPSWVVPGLLLLFLVGCSVSVNKNKAGEDKNVSIHTPLGGLQVRENGTTPQDVGLPGYPGAVAIADKDNGGSADVRVGFGDWQLTVRAAKFQTADPEAKVLAFYHAALAQYGAVLECRGSTPVGSPAVTSEGLTCDDRGGHGGGFHLSPDEGDHNLRAGSRRHQHIVGLSPTGTGGTRFTLLEVQLPKALESHGKEE